MALNLSTDRDNQYGAALALGFAGSIAPVQPLRENLAKRFPEDTAAKFSYLPTLDALLALARDNPGKAIDALQVAAPYELGQPGQSLFIFSIGYPIYLRGVAYLAARRGSEAAAEFQKLLDHRGVVVNEPIGALAHLGLARAYRLQGDTTRARAAYQDFLTLWKDADPDIPIFKQAKSELAAL